MNQTIISVAERLNISPEWLSNVIKFESRNNPKAQNPIPYNLARVKKYGEAPKYARGLIQFIDETAQGLGFKDSLDLVTKYPDFDSQLNGPVYNYLKAMKPFPTEQNFYMSIFLPSARNLPPSTVLSDTVRAVNPGINTIADYVNKVAGRKNLPLTLLPLVLIAGGAYLFYKYFS